MTKRSIQNIVIKLAVNESKNEVNIKDDDKIYIVTLIYDWVKYLTYF